MKRSSMSKGFKPKAESISLEMRNKLGLRHIDACPARGVARLLRIDVVSIQAVAKIASTHLADQFNLSLVKNSLQELESDKAGFSAVATVIGSQKIILFSELHSTARQESDIMHELAHLICEHPGNCLSQSLRKFDQKHEQEAIWLGATLQIPESGLFELVKRGFSNQQIADNYGASLQMATYRRNILGVDIRLRRSKEANNTFGQKNRVTPKS